MPSAAPQAFPYFAETCIVLRPESILDVGCGLGLYGLAAKIYAGVWSDKDVSVSDGFARVYVDGVEVFKDAIRPYHRDVYDAVYECSIQDYLSGRSREYDMIWQGDNLEHLEREAGELVVKALWAKARKLYMMTFPLDGKLCPNRKHHESKWEGHKSAWVPKDIKALLPDCRLWYRQEFRQWIVWAWKIEPPRMRGGFGIWDEVNDA
jgi:hypothetical protein